MSEELRRSVHEAVDKVFDELTVPTPSGPRIRVCVDAGHGGNDPGAVAADGTQEKDVVLPYSEKLAEALRARGHSVLETRTRDSFVELSERARMANVFGADCFVSIHANASLNPQANGAWVIHAKGSGLGKLLAQDIFKELALIPGIPDADPETEVFPDGSGPTGGRSLTVLRRTAMPAVLVELGFMTNEDDLAQLQSVDTLERVTTAIFRGIETWSK